MYEKGFCWGGCLNQASSLIIVTMLIVSLNKERNGIWGAKTTEYIKYDWLYS